MQQRFSHQTIMLKRTGYILIFVLLCNIAPAQHAYDEYDDVEVIEAPVTDKEVTIGTIDSQGEKKDEFKYYRRYASEHKLEEYRSKKTFQYKDWENEFKETEYEKPKQSSATINTGGFDPSYLFWFLGILALLAVILQLSGVNLGRIFFPARDKKQVAENETADTDIHSIPFDKELQAAIAAKNYKLAVRLLYLRNLKLLSDKKIIIWDEHKTGRQYIYEIKDANLRNSFISTNSIYEIVCFGERSVDEQTFGQIHDLFNNLKTQIR